MHASSRFGYTRCLSHSLLSPFSRLSIVIRPILLTRLLLRFAVVRFLYLDANLAIGFQRRLSPPLGLQPVASVPVAFVL